MKHIITSWSTNYPTLLLEIQNNFNVDLYEVPIFVLISSQSGLNDFDSTWIFNYTSDYKNLGAFCEGEELQIEVAEWDTTNKYAQLWVKVPFIMAYDAAYIYLQIDPSKNNPKINPIGSAQDVWDVTFESVYHFCQNIDPGIILDSSRNNRSLTPYNMDTNTNLVDFYNEDGKFIGKGFKFNDGVTNEYLQSSTHNYEFLKNGTIILFNNVLSLNSNNNWTRMLNIGEESTGDISIDKYSNTNKYAVDIWGYGVDSLFEIPLNKSQVLSYFIKDGYRFCLNGSKISKNINTTSIKDLSNSKLITSNLTTITNYYMHNTQKELFLFNKVLTQEEMKFYTKNLQDKLVLFSTI